MLRSLQASGQKSLPGSNNQDHQIFNLFTKQPAIFLKKYKYEEEPSKSDQELCLNLMKTIENSQLQIQNKIVSTLQTVQQRQYTKGIGYFNAKNVIFMEYLIQLQFYELFKINGVSLTEGQGLNLYKRLAYLKTLLTKLDPIQKKLQYQKNKMLKQSDLVPIQPENNQQNNDSQQEQEAEQDASNREDQGNKKVEEQSESDDLAYRPRPQVLLKVKKNKQIKPTDKYIAPKTSAVLSKQDKIKRRQEIQEERRKIALIKKYRDDLIEDEDARQIGAQNEVQERIKQRFNEKRLIEEEHFMRLPETKKEKFMKKQIIRNFNKSDDLRDTLKQVQMVGKIYRQQRKEEDKVQIMPKRQKKSHTLQKKNGRKKTKYE